MMRSLAVAGGLLFAGCNQFVGPPVQCEVPREIINIDQTATAARAGAPCTFADPYPFTVTYAPRSDRTLLDSDGVPLYSTKDDRSLIGQPVTVTQGSAATLLCAGVGAVCTEGSPSITTAITPAGLLSYQGLFTVEPLGVVLNAGDTFQWQGVVATENFGPGNSCPLTAKLNLTCQKAQ